MFTLIVFRVFFFFVNMNLKGLLMGFVRCLNARFRTSTMKNKLKRKPQSVLSKPYCTMVGYGSNGDKKNKTIPIYHSLFLPPAPAPRPAPPPCRNSRVPPPALSSPYNNADRLGHDSRNGVPVPRPRPCEVVRDLRGVFPARRNRHGGCRTLQTKPRSRGDRSRSRC